MDECSSLKANILSANSAGAEQDGWEGESGNMEGPMMEKWLRRHEQKGDAAASRLHLPKCPRKQVGGQRPPLQENRSREGAVRIKNSGAWQRRRFRSLRVGRGFWDRI
jgi:hypothetical protein